MQTSDYIAAAGVIVTGIFSWLVWGATKETANATQAAADIAKATLKLNEDLAKREELREKEFNNLRKLQLTPKILRESEDVLNAIVEVEPLNIVRKLKTAPKELSVDKTEIAKYFTPKEAETITKAWQTYEEYRAKYVKEFYHGDTARELLNNSAPVVQAFGQLIHLLKYQV